MINSIIIDDEPYSSESLEILLTKYCPDIKIIGVFNDSREALPEIIRLKPDLLFLDIQMPHLSGFELLERISEPEFRVIFTTSHDQYAINAIRFSALDYLLKPVDPVELTAAVKKIDKKPGLSAASQLSVLLEKRNKRASEWHRIVLPTLEGLELIPVQTIISCEARSNYTVLLLENQKKIVVSRTLKEIEDMLSEHSFLRVHNSYLVNLNAVKKFLRADNGQLVMKDDSVVDVSRRKKDEVIQKLHEMR